MWASAMTVAPRRGGVSLAARRNVRSEAMASSAPPPRPRRAAAIVATVSLPLGPAWRAQAGGLKASPARAAAGRVAQARGGSVRVEARYSGGGRGGSVPITDRLLAALPYLLPLLVRLSARAFTWPATSPSTLSPRTPA